MSSGTADEGVSSVHDMREFYSDPNLQEMIWSSSLFLLLLVLLLNFIAKRISDRTRY